MPADYDLIVIGNSHAGICAAIGAARLKARVALITQNSTLSGSELLNTHVFQEIGQFLWQTRQAEHIGFWSSSGSPQSRWLESASQWAKGVSETIETLYSPAGLSSLGIEVIEGQGGFCRKPKPGFIVNGRYLRSRAYLLAIGCRPIIPEIAGLETLSYLTAEVVLQESHTVKPSSSLVIIGTDPVGVELAQTFTRFRVQVTIVTPATHVLPNEDIETAQLIQAQLEAEGIRVFTQTSVTQVRQIQEKKWVQAGNQAIETDEILLATGWEPDVSSLNLEAVDLRPNSLGIQVNPKLQTSNPRIYACTGLSDRHYIPHLAVAQARVALKNALFFPISTMNDHNIPVVVHTNPELARVGLTEHQAIKQYGKEVVILRQSFQTLTRAQIRGETTGFCKFILRRNGKILGAQIVGAQAGEMIGAIALAMQRHLNIQTLAKVVYPSVTFAEIISQTAQQWNRLCLERSRRLQDCLEGFFDFRRLQL
ncbi:dihydrolipoyl dehydrogenase family protein [Leptothermofonsia sp. ETS-13]|uniref:dihydrolipoyl dehydrogenase family protein n=1 Tax=Leptothermofonsia sp. ETS-13 TaxID=3035696 RepID=UPI003B9EC456